MPTRRQLLSGSAASAVGVGAAAALSSCAPPPPAVAPRRYATLYRQINGYRRDLLLWDAHGQHPTAIVASVFGRPAWFPDGMHLCVSRGTADDSLGTWALWMCRVDGTVLHAITAPHIGTADLDPCVGPDGQTIAFSPRHDRIRHRSGNLDRAGERAGAASRPGSRGRDLAELQS